LIRGRDWDIERLTRLESESSELCITVRGELLDW
jgi:hypothetical protein